MKECFSFSKGTCECTRPELELQERPDTFEGVRVRVCARGIESRVRSAGIRSGDGEGDGEDDEDRLMSARGSVVDEEVCIVQTTMFIYKSRKGDD